MRAIPRLFACVVLAASTVAPPMLAEAMPMPTPPVQKSTLQQTSPDLTDVRWRKRCNRNRCRRVWVPRRHYRPRAVIRPRVVIRPRAVIRPRVVIRDRARLSRHDRWCMNRYQSYNPSTNRYLTYSGNYRRCNSPYR